MIRKNPHSKRKSFGGMWNLIHALVSWSATMSRAATSENSTRPWTWELSDFCILTLFGLASNTQARLGKRVHAVGTNRVAAGLALAEAAPFVFRQGGINFG